MEEDVKSIVIDSGSSVCKCGISGTDVPVKIPSVYGKVKHPNSFMNTLLKEAYIG